MTTTKIYRADDYYNNTGNLLGFFSTKEDAESELEFSSPTKIGDGTFSQITEFEVEKTKLKDVEINDNKTMLSEQIWGDSDVYNESYYI